MVPFGALAFGIGTSEVEHVLATQTLRQKRAKTFQVEFQGSLPKGVTAKDMILKLIGQIGTAGGTGHVLEYTGPAIRSLSMEARMTVCNMSIEAGAKAGMIAPDDVTFQYLSQGERPFAPKRQKVGRSHFILEDSGQRSRCHLTTEASRSTPRRSPLKLPGARAPAW